MFTRFFQYTDQFVKFSSEEKAIISSLMHSKCVEKKTELVSFGNYSNELFFLDKGCIRKFFVKDGEEITIYISTQNSFFVDYDSLLNGTKSKETIECIEPCELLILGKTDLNSLYQQVPLMNELIRKILERTLIQFQQSLTTFILHSPQERYIKLLTENPEILQRVPQHMLATYLGMTATSLSRIRKRILAE